MRLDEAADLYEAVTCNAQMTHHNNYDTIIVVTILINYHH